MQAVRFVLAMFVAGMACVAAAAQAAPPSFDEAEWIWTSPGPLNTMGAGVGYFRAEVDIPENPALRSAEIAVTCDNLFVLYINGRPVGESDADNSAWQRPKRWDLTDMLVPGRTVLAIEAVNTLPGPAALIVRFVAELADGQKIKLTSGPAWKCNARAVSNWQQPDFDDQKWSAAAVVGNYGNAPWKKVAIPAAAASPDGKIGEVARLTRQVLEQSTRRGSSGPVVEQEPTAEFAWPEAIAFVGDDCSLYRPRSKSGRAEDSLTVTIFNPRKARTFPEHDLPAPMKVGRKLYVLAPARPGTQPRVLLDAGDGAIGSPSVTYDGRSILVSMAYGVEPCFHIYRLPAEGGSPQRLTNGPFHDIDPVELPDGRIVFTSTRIGRFEEYHSPPSRSLFVMGSDGRDVRPLTHTIIFDNEAEVLADGRILFIRSDNFFDRGKVETLLHAVHPDGSEGYTEFGLDNGPEYGGRLRAYLCGSPAPMPDGRVAFVSGPGITVGRMGYPAKDLRHLTLEAGDVAALPDGRLLCTTPVRVPLQLRNKTVQDLSYEKIGVLDPDSQPPSLTILHQSTTGPLHSPVYLGTRPRPPQLARKVQPEQDRDVRATGVLYCQDARFTQQTTAGWPHIRAIRVLAGTGLTIRSSHSYIVHAGNETVELGTVPLAPDGSFAVEVPADTPISLQAVDAEGRAELNEMSWIYVRPGERRGCLGCHHKRQAAPPGASPMPLALTARPVRLVGQGRPLRFRGNNPAVTGLMELQFDRFREVAGINRHGDTPDPLASGGDEVAALAAQLGGDDPALKHSAAGRLAIFRSPAAAPALARCLQDYHREVRLAAAIALAACGTRESVPPLVDALADRDPLVAQAAAVALENLTGHAEPFNPFVGFSQRRQQAEAWRRWIAATPWEHIERELIERLDSSQRDEVRRAAVALGHTGSSVARAPLRNYLAVHRHHNPYPEWKKTHKVDATRFNSLAEVNPRTLQAVTRALGCLGDASAVPLLAETLRQHHHPDRGNLFLAEAAVEALGRIGTPEAQVALVEAFAELDDYPKYTLWYGDHPALMSCHASPVHYLIVEALDALGSTRAESILPLLIRSVPIDPDRALLPGNDDFETLTGRVIRRHRAQAVVVETCLAVLGDEQAARTPSIEQALGTIRCWAGHPGPENRAAQILSLVCADGDYEPRVRAAFQRYRAMPVDIPRVFDTGIPVVNKLPLKNWVCFYLARTLGNLADPASAEDLISALRQSAPEAASGRPDPLGPGVLFLHNDLTPCWRAAGAWALGRIGDRRAVPALLAVVDDLKNAPDTRHAAAEALGHIADPTSLEAIRKLAADYPEESTRRALVRASAGLSTGRTVGQAAQPAE